MQRVDANGDGKLDCAEFIELFEQLYLDAGTVHYSSGWWFKQTNNIMLPMM